MKGAKNLVARCPRNKNLLLSDVLLVFVIKGDLFFNFHLYCDLNSCIVIPVLFLKKRERYETDEKCRLLTIHAVLRKAIHNNRICVFHSLISETVLPENCISFVLGYRNAEPAVYRYTVNRVIVIGYIRAATQDGARFTGL